MKYHDSIRLVGVATLGPKGQVVIPADTREAMGIVPGDKLHVMYLDGKQAVAFITEKQMQELVDKMGERISGLKTALNQIKKH